jgi:hypothetical protein
MPSCDWPHRVSSLPRDPLEGIRSLGDCFAWRATNTDQKDKRDCIDFLCSGWSNVDCRRKRSGLCSPPARRSGSHPGRWPGGSRTAGASGEAPRPAAPRRRASRNAVPAFDSFWPLLIVSLIQATALAPLAPLADAITVTLAVTRARKAGGFKYGWVRGAGSAGFIVGSLAASSDGQYLSGSTRSRSDTDLPEPLIAAPHEAVHDVFLLLFNHAGFALEPIKC